jgi:isocitrate dehydrogenase
MERIPSAEATELYDTVAGVYAIVFDADVAAGDIELYDIDSAYVEAEIDMPYIGINHDDWTTEWSPERRLEVLLHEFAHVEESADEPDHGPAFYDRLVDLTTTAEQNIDAIEALFDAVIDLEELEFHIIESVNEYTIETDIESPRRRRQALREAFRDSKNGKSA